MKTKEKDKGSQHSHKPAIDEGFLKALVAIARTLSQSLSPEMLLNTTLELTLTDPRVEAGEIYLLDDKSGELSYACHRGLSEECVQEAKEVPIKLGEGVIGQVAAQKEPLVVLELSEEPRFLREMPQKEGYRALVSVPMKSGDRVYGVINLFARDGQRLSPRYMGWLTANMEMVGVAFGYVQVFEERNATLKALRESEEKYRFLVEDMNEGYMVIQGPWVVFANKRCAEYTGIPLENMVGASIADLLPPETLEQAMELTQTSMRDGKFPEQVEMVFKKEDGSKFPADIRFKEVTFEGKPALSLLIRDIAERKQAEEALQRRAQQILALQRVTASMQSTLDLKQVLQHVSEAVVLNLGFDHSLILLIDESRNVVQGTVFYTKGGSKLVGEVQEAIAQALTAVEVPLERGYSRVVDDSLDRKTTITHHLYEIAEPPLTREQCDAAQELIEAKAIANVPLFAKDKPVGTILAFTEKEGITEAEMEALGLLAGEAGIAIENAELYRQAEARAEALRASEEKLRIMFESIKDGITLTDLGGQIVEVNEAALRMYGDSRKEEVIGRNAFEFIAERDRDRTWEGVRKIFEEEHPVTTEYTLLTIDGREFDSEATVALLRDSSGNPAGVINVARDITERKKAEEALKQSEAKYRALVDGITDAHIVLRGDRIVFANKRCSEGLGLPLKQIIGQRFFKFVTPESLQLATQLYERSMGGEKLSAEELYEVTLIRKDGTSLPVEVVFTHTIYEGKPAVSAIMRDITERKRAEELLHMYTKALEHSNRELEQFAYVASHDLQEPLRMVSSYTQLLAKRYKGQLDADAGEFIAYAVDGASRMQKMINDLLDYSRVGTRGKDFAPTDCEAVLPQALSNLEIAIEESGAVVTHDPLPTVIADDSQLVHLFQNLIGNAIKFHGEEPPRVHISAEQAGNDWTFSVHDNGIGIAPEFFDRIFAIFQRLHGKNEYPGTGIGLAICRKIVERHSGQIWVESEQGKGTTFYFTIPAKEGNNHGGSNDGSTC